MVIKIWGITQSNIIYKVNLVSHLPLTLNLRRKLRLTSLMPVG